MVIDQADSDNSDDNDSENKQKVDESTGKEHFYLCERWKNAREPMFLLNQTCNFGYGAPDGSISALVSNKYALSTEKRQALENSKFILIMLSSQNFMNEIPRKKQEKNNMF